MLQFNKVSNDPFFGSLFVSQLTGRANTLDVLCAVRGLPAGAASRRRRRRRSSSFKMCTSQSKHHQHHTTAGRGRIMMVAGKRRNSLRCTGERDTKRGKGRASERTRLPFCFTVCFFFYVGFGVFFGSFFSFFPLSLLMAGRLLHLSNSCFRKDSF